MIMPVLDEVYLFYDDKRIKFHQMEREVIEIASLSSKNGRKIAIFYPSETYDCILPFSLELLYQYKYKMYVDSSLIIFAGSHAPIIREIYSHLNVNGTIIASNFVGIAYITKKKLSTLKPKGMKKICSDDLLLSNNYLAFPPDHLAEKLNSAVIISYPHGMFFKTLAEIKWCEENRIKNIIIFDNLPTYRKLKNYISQGFIIYGWDSSYIRLNNKSSDNDNPVSSPQSLRSFETMQDIYFVEVNDPEINAYLKCLSESIEKIRKFSDDIDSKENLIFRESQFIFRKLCSISTPLWEYEKIELKRLGIIDRINSVIHICESYENGIAPAEISQIKNHLDELRSRLTSKNPKFEFILNEIGQSINKKEKVIVFLASEQDVIAFKNLAESRAKHLADKFKDGVIFETIYCSPYKYYGSEFAKAVFCTYLPLSRNRLIENISAREKIIIVYQIEKSTLVFFNKLRSKIEEIFFSNTSREKAKNMIQSGEPYDIPKSIGFIKEIEKGAADSVKNDVERKPTGIISLLTDFEESIEPEPILYEKISPDVKEIKKKLFINGVVIGLYGVGSLFLRPEKIVQVMADDDDIKYKRASDIKMGDQILLINHQLKKSLDELILEKTAEYPKIQIIRELAKLWRRELLVGMFANNDTETTLLEKMQKIGSKIKSDITLRLWKDGYVIGPLDPKNIERISEIYKSDVIKANLKGIIAAIKKMRGIRREILRRVKNIMIEGDENDEIKKLGINIDEMAQYVEFFEVISVDKRENIPIARLNVVEGNYEL